MSTPDWNGDFEGADPCDLATIQMFVDAIMERILGSGGSGSTAINELSTYRSIGCYGGCPYSSALYPRWGDWNWGYLTLIPPATEYSSVNARAAYLRPNTWPHLQRLVDAMISSSSNYIDQLTLPSGVYPDLNFVGFNNRKYNVGFCHWALSLNPAENVDVAGTIRSRAGITDGWTRKYPREVDDVTQPYWNSWESAQPNDTAVCSSDNKVYRYDYSYVWTSPVGATPDLWPGTPVPKTIPKPNVTVLRAFHTAIEGQTAQCPTNGRSYLFTGGAWAETEQPTAADVVETTGYLMLGDYIGPWILRQMRDVLNQLCICIIDGAMYETANTSGDDYNQPMTTNYLYNDAHDGGWVAYVDLDSRHAWGTNRVTLFGCRYLPGAIVHPCVRAIVARNQTHTAVFDTFGEFPGIQPLDIVWLPPVTVGSDGTYYSQAFGPTSKPESDANRTLRGWAFDGPGAYIDLRPVLRYRPST